MEVVYTWVDDTFAGYKDLLNQFSETKHDLNPNRTRNNIDILKYSLRSLEKYAPWVSKVTLITMRPQIPDWIEPDCHDLNILHHDQFIDAQYLPTFSSFSIISHFHKLADLPNRFIYLEDDMVLGRPVRDDIFYTQDNKINVWLEANLSPDKKRRFAEKDSPWNRALSYCNFLLDETYLPERRKMLRHSPLLIDRELWAKMVAQWPAAFELTMKSKFRSTGNVAPEFLYRYFLLKEGHAHACTPKKSGQINDYWGLENNCFFNKLGLMLVKRRSRPFITLNDNFGDNPRKQVVDDVRHFLEQTYPDPSRFESAV
ncbi:stealth conserved region 3 domain-containing protein [Terasakiella pusilla]|uniref:stealth conserved region 3 domain-containing protein n=1 Tax=Terasakiella pusilla TaxID=64973 RepID=UPI000491CB95|nr:stealth conserved region 3 domain-containing protein [Terasakiella pusilla]